MKTRTDFWFQRAAQYLFDHLIVAVVTRGPGSPDFETG